MRGRLAVLAWKVAVAQGVALAIGYVAARQGGALRPAELRAVAAGLAAIWAVDWILLFGVGPVALRPLAEALRDPGAVSPGQAARAASLATWLPTLASRAVLSVGLVGCAALAAVAVVRDGLQLDVAVAELAIGTAVCLLGAMLAFALCAGAAVELAEELGAGAEAGAPGTLRGKITLLAVGLDLAAVLLVAATAYLRHRGAAPAGLAGEALVRQMRPFASSLFLTSALVVAASAGVAALLARAVTLPFRTLGSAADRIASGDLTASPPSVSADELGRLAAQFRGMAQGLTGLVREVQAASEQVSAGALEAGSIGEQIRRGALDQHDGVESVQDAVAAMERSMALVSHGLEGLSEYVSATSRAVGDMARAFDDVQKRAAELERATASGLSDVEGLGTAGRDAEGRLSGLETLAAGSTATLADVRASVAGLERAATESEGTAAAVADMADRAGVVVEGTVHGIETLRGAVADAHQRIAVLGRRSDDIDQVVDFISEVAGRTNLLSLNASIIAAQAGEHGKAFAVVADQIRDLASQIARSTKSIGDIIHAVREDVEGTAALIDRGDALAAEGVQLARNSLGALAEIRRSTSRGRETAAGIRTAVQAHARASNDMAGLVELVVNGSRAVADAVQLVGRSVSGVHTISRGVTSMADRVVRTLEEQAGQGKRQLENLSRLEEMIQETSRAVESHAVATTRVKKALLALSRATGQHESAVRGLSGVSDRIGTSARALSERVNRFKV